jgi:hypothetical protein
MFHGSHDTFAMVISFINVSREPTHITIGIFEVCNIVKASMANHVKVFWFLNKVIAYVNDKDFNLNTLTITLTNVVFYYSL